MTSIKVPPEVKAYIEKLKLKNQQLTEENARLLHELDSIGVNGPSSKKVQTIQATGKIWKFLIVAGGLGLIASILGIVIGFTIDNPTTASFSVLVLVVSVLLYGAGRLGKFWFHE